MTKLMDIFMIVGGTDISSKNESYCELTALYWLWKHSNADIKGLFHYRRMFYSGAPMKCNRRIIEKKAKSIARCIITEEQIEEYLREYDVIDEIPYCPGTRSAEEDLQRFCYPKDIEKMKQVMQNNFPEYYDTFIDVLQSRHISYCNMMITRADVLDGYCTWLFDVLSKCEEVIDISSYDTNHKRIYGYFAEVLMNVYIRQHQLREKHVPLLLVYEYTTKEMPNHTLRWLKANIIRMLGKMNVSVPTTDTELIRLYYEYEKYLRKNIDSAQ